MTHLKKGVYRILVGKPEGEIPLGRPRHRWEDNIQMHLQEVGMCGYVLDRAGFGLGQVTGTCKSGTGPLGSIKCGTYFD